MRWMLKNAKGSPDAMLTVAVITLGVVLVKMLAAGLVVGSVTIGPAPDALSIGALLTPTLGAYVARRNGVLARAIPEAKP